MSPIVGFTLNLMFFFLNVYNLVMAKETRSWWIFSLIIILMILQVFLIVYYGNRLF